MNTINGRQEDGESNPLTTLPRPRAMHVQLAAAFSGYFVQWLVRAVTSSLRLDCRADEHDVGL